MRYVTYAAAVVPQSTTSGAVITGVEQFAQQNPLWLIIGGIFGLIARAPFAFQDNEPFHMIRIFFSVLSIGLGGYGFMTNGHKLLNK